MFRRAVSEVLEGRSYLSAPEIYTSSLVEADEVISGYPSGTQVYLSGTITYDGNDPLSYTVDWGDGNSEPFSTLYDEFSVSHYYNDSGEYYASISAYASEEENASAPVTVSIANSDPWGYLHSFMHGTFSPAITTEGSGTAEFDVGFAGYMNPADYIDADGDYGSLHFSFADSLGALEDDYSEAGTDVTATFEYSRTDNSMHTIYGRILDKDGGVFTGSTVVHITNVDPTATISGAPTSSTEGASISLGQTHSDPGTADTFTYSWTVTKNGSSFATGTSSTLNFTATDNGTYVVNLAVTDDDGGVGNATARTFTVTNTAPTAIFTRTTGAVTTSNTDNVTFTITDVLDPSSADTAAGFTYAFDMNNGDFLDAGETTPSSTSSKAAHWTTEGTKYAYVRVYDKDGGYTQYRLTVYANDLSNDSSGISVGSDGVILTGAEASDAWVLVGGTYVYNPPRWNRNPSNNNCYNYAMNYTGSYFAQPGAYGGYYGPLIEPDIDSSHAESIVNFITAVQADSDANQGVSEAQPIIYIDPEHWSSTLDWAENTANYNEYYIVALYLDPLDISEDPEAGDRDYHWYRHDGDGNWSHKMSFNPATNLDADNQVISDLDEANRSGSVYNYSVFVGYFAVHMQPGDPVIVG